MLVKSKNHYMVIDFSAGVETVLLKELLRTFSAISVKLAVIYLGHPVLPSV